MAETTLTEEQKVAALWHKELELAEAACQQWWRSGDIIIRRYKNEERNGKGGANAALTPRRRYAILWSNVQTIAPSIYAKSPNAVVSRRFRDADPVGKVASEVLERAVNYSIEAYDFDSRMQLARNDYLLPGRGQAWVRYIPTIEQNAIDADEGEEDVPSEVVTYEEVQCDHVAWKDFLTNPTREWSETRWVSRRVFMTREMLEKRFGEEIAHAVPLDWSPSGQNAAATSGDKDEASRRAQIYEIWDKTTRKAYWISRGHSVPLDVRDDPLKLKNFFPCPCPLSATMGPDSTIPVPDYVLYQDQAEELDELTARIGKLQDALRMVGFYAGENKIELQRAFAPGQENTLIPVESWAMFKEGGGTRGLIEWVPIDMVMQCLSGCYESRTQIINDIYQITGLSDIIRGDSNPNETATAQGIKAQWGSLRVRDRQKEVQRFARDIIRLKAEIIAEQFSIDTLKQMTGVQLLTNAEKQQISTQQQQMQMAQQMGLPTPPMPPIDPKMMELMNQPSWEDVMGLLKNDALRSFRIDVETDSTIEADEVAAKQALVEGVGAITQAMQAAAGIVPAAPYAAPIFAEVIKETARTFRLSRALEDIIDRVFEQAAAQPPAQPPGPPPVDPVAMQAEQIKGQTAMFEAQNEAERTKVEAQLGMGELAVKEQEIRLKAAALAADPTPQGVA